jgi:DNA polymerase elongation subunit (family B)
VSEFFLGEGQTKDPLTVKGIFKCYRMFTTDSLSVVGKYCVQDSLLVLKLFEKLQLWIGLCEMSNTCNVPIFTLFTQGQQIKMYSQVYKKCLHDNIVIDSEAAALVSPSDTDDKYTGAYVFPPVPGLYEMVTSYDFSSLYPSAIIAYNIDYTTLVLDKNVPDDKCHIFDWHDHLGCSHDQIIRKTKIKNPICEKRYFRFLKEPLGIVPTLLKNLLDARKKTNAEKKELQKLLGGLQGVEKEDVERMIVVLDKRQLSYKINANSMYGAMGARKGYLPFLPGAMCTTFKGRVSIEKAAKWLVENHQANLVYGDTDSCYVSFPQYTTPAHAKDMDSFCREIEFLNQILKMFFIRTCFKQIQFIIV